MIVMSLLQMQIPKWINKLSKRNEKKTKKEPKQTGGMLGNTMNMTMYMTTALIAFMYISWPIAMSFYWLVSSIIRACTSVLSHFISEKDLEKREQKQIEERTQGVLKNRKKR